jgi:hypothetical protein
MIDKILEVTQNDKGAIRVLDALRYFADFENMLEWLSHSKYKGHALWELYKNHFNKDITNLANFIRQSA